MWSVHVIFMDTIRLLMGKRGRILETSCYSVEMTHCLVRQMGGLQCRTGSLLPFWGEWGLFVVRYSEREEQQLLRGKMHMSVRRGEGGPTDIYISLFLRFQDDWVLSWFLHPTNGSLEEPDIYVCSQGMWKYPNPVHKGWAEAPDQLSHSRLFVSLTKTFTPRLSGGLFDIHANAIFLPLCLSFRTM